MFSCLRLQTFQKVVESKDTRLQFGEEFYSVTVIKPDLCAF